MLFRSIAVKLGQEVGIDRVIKTAKAMGIKSPLEENPSLALGSSDVNLQELVSAYGTVVNDGKAKMPLMVTKIIDRKGNIIFDGETKEKQAIPYKTAFFMQQLLRAGLTEPGGTTQALWSYLHPIAEETDFGGKTGTSNRHADAWFVGITPNLVAGAWVGGEYRSIHFRTGELGQGSRTALPIYGEFMRILLLDPQFAHYKGKFSPSKEEIDPSCYNCRGDRKSVV